MSDFSVKTENPAVPAASAWLQELGAEVTAHSPSALAATPAGVAAHAGAVRLCTQFFESYFSHNDAFIVLLIPMIAVSTTEIQKALRSLQLHQVLLFGSHAKGMTHDDSDLDLIAVVPTKHPQMNFTERVQWIRQIRRALESEGIRGSMDILVYSREQWKQFRSTDSGFARDIRQSALRIA